MQYVPPVPLLLLRKLASNFSPAEFSPFSWYSHRAPYYGGSPALGDAPTNVADRGTAGKTLTQAGATNALRQVDADGREGSLFDGTSSRLHNTNFNIDLSTGWTIYGAFRFIIQTGVIHNLGTANVNSGLSEFVNGSAVFRAYTGGGGGLSSAVLALDTPYWFCHWCDTATQRLYIDGVLVDEQAAGVPASTAVLSVGGTADYAPLNGLVYESLFFVGPQTNGQRTSMFGYMDSLRI